MCRVRRICLSVSRCIYCRMYRRVSVRSRVCRAVRHRGGNCLGVHAHAAPLERDNGCLNAMARIVIASCDLFPFLWHVLWFTFKTKYVYMDLGLRFTYRILPVMREFAFSLRYMRHVTDTRGASAVRGVVSEE